MTPYIIPEGASQESNVKSIPESRVKLGNHDPDGPPLSLKLTGVCCSVGRELHYSVQRKRDSPSTTLRDDIHTIDHFAMSLRPWTCRKCVQRLSTPHTQKRFVAERFLQRHITAKWEWANREDQIQKGLQKSMLAILEERGFVHQIAGGRENLDNLMNAKRIGAYVGVDPTAASIHVGHLVPFMALFWMYLHGYQTVTLIGGTTARIGDPTGRTTQREKMDSIDRKSNITQMHVQLKGIWMHVEELGRKYGYNAHRSWKRAVLNNNIWLNKATVPEILMLMGGGLRMGSLLSRDSVKNRLESTEGMSFSEFCYPLLQAWDWWHMYQSRSIQLQIGGADQFGNIITGIEGVKHVARTHPHNDVRVNEEEQNWEPMGFTVPLMTTSSGEKFGKSAGNAVWLNREMTSPFDLYAYMLSTSDADVERYLKLFTFIPLDEISKIVSQHSTQPEKRIAQHLLASEFLALAHGSTVATETAEKHKERASQRRVINIREHLEKSKADVDASLNRDVYTPEVQTSNSRGAHATANNSSTETVSVSREFLEQNGFPALLYAVGLAGSNSEGHRLIANQGAYVGGNIGKNPGELADDLQWRRITNTFKGIPLNHVFWSGDRGLLVLRVGKWKVKIVRVYCGNTPILTDSIQELPIEKDAPSAS